MNLSRTIAKHLPSKFAPDHPYVLYLDDYGAIGDKFNMGDSSTGVRFPPKASSRFKTKKRAEEVLKEFLKYVNAKIKDAAAKKRSDNKLEEKKRSRPSYFLWN